jgi:hypothetical protein
MTVLGCLEIWVVWKKTDKAKAKGGRPSVALRFGRDDAFFDFVDGLKRTG